MRYCTGLTALLFVNLPASGSRIHLNLCVSNFGRLLTPAIDCCQIVLQVAGTVSSPWSSEKWSSTVAN